MDSIKPDIKKCKKCKHFQPIDMYELCVLCDDEEDCFEHALYIDCDHIKKCDNEKCHLSKKHQ